MDTLRIFITILNFVCITIIHISPNGGQEMGTQEGDKPCKNGVVDNYFLKLCALICIYGFLTFWSIIYNAPNPLTLAEYSFVIMSLSGVILRLWSYYALNKYFTFTLGVRKEHKLITTGPYSILVHPSYTGQILASIGSLLFLRAYWLVIIAILFNHFTAYKRFKAEEEMLTKEFGDEYTNYLKTRWRFVPYVY